MHKEIQRILQDLSKSLQDLHRALLMIESKSLESEDGVPVNPYDLLRASLHDPRFAWLRKISMLIVYIDTLIDEIPNLSGRESNDVASQVLTLIEKPDATGDQEFWQKYSHHLSSNPEIIMKHAQVKSILESLKPKI